jgi:hypothetical protein
MIIQHAFRRVVPGVTQRNTGRRTAGIGLPLFLGIIA